jgi:hypothetical protein
VVVMVMVAAIHMSDDSNISIHIYFYLYDQLYIFSFFFLCQIYSIYCAALNDSSELPTAFKLHLVVAAKVYAVAAKMQGRHHHIII